MWAMDYDHAHTCINLLRERLACSKARKSNRIIWHAHTDTHLEIFVLHLVLSAFPVVEHDQVFAFECVSMEVHVFARDVNMKAPG